MRLHQSSVGRAIRGMVILSLGEERALSVARRVTARFRDRGIPRTYCANPAVLGPYWVEMRGHGRTPRLKDLGQAEIHADEWPLLQERYEAPWVDYPFGRHRNPVTTTQWGFADLLRAAATGERRFYERAAAAGEWLLEQQSSDGAWRVGFDFADLPRGWVSAMYQGQAISLLLRLNSLAPDGRLVASSQAAYEFMMKDQSGGGTLGRFSDGSPVLEEYPGSARYPHVLNGSIFALLGVYDLWLSLGDAGVFRTWEELTASLENHLRDYDTGRWTTYATGPPIASPDYHRLHIAQCRVMYALRGGRVWRSTARRWERYLVRWAGMPTQSDGYP